MLTDDWDYVQNAVSGFGALPKAIQSYIEIRVNTKYIHVVFRFLCHKKPFVLCRQDSEKDKNFFLALCFMYVSSLYGHQNICSSFSMPGIIFPTNRNIYSFPN